MGIILLGLAIRVILLPISFHSDLNNNAIWGIYAQEFGLRGFYDWLNFGNYARPDYPPLAMVLFLVIRNIWQIFFNFFWFLNTTISVFPSKFIPWFETNGYLSLIKVPGIISDIGITYLIYNFIRNEKSHKVAKSVASLFLFNPAIIYLSASWGQLDSIVSFFALSATIFLLKLKYLKSTFFYLTSILIKATYFPLAVVLFISSLKSKINLKNILLIFGVSFLYLYLIGGVFTDHSYFLWSVRTYVDKILPGAITLPYINLNAFNFWGLILGLERISDGSLFLGIPLYNWAWGITIIFASLILLKFVKGQNIFFCISLLYFSLFLFMPRVHERYLYPFFVFFPFVLAKLPKLKKYFYILSGIFLLNLYHWWWFPRIDFLVNIIDAEFIERTLSLSNILIFGTLLRSYLKNS